MKSYSILLVLLMSCSFLSAQVLEEEAEIDKSPPPVSANTDVKPRKVTHAFHGKIGGRYGFYLGDEWLIPPVYDELSKEYSDFMVAKKDKKYGVIDRLNNEIFPFEYDSFHRKMLDWKTREYADYYMVKKDSLLGVCDMKGNFIIPVKYTSLHLIGDKYFSFGTKKDGYGLMEKNGHIFISQKYEQPLSIAKEGVLLAKKDGKIRFIDFQEKITVPLELDMALFESGVYKILKDDKWGIMTKDLEVVVEPKYSFIKRRFNKIFKVVLDDKWGALNSNFQEIIPTKYTSLELFHSLYFAATLDEERSLKGVIDTMGNQLLDFEYSKLNRGGGNLIFAKKRLDRLFSVFNNKGVQISPPTYLAISGLNKDFSYAMIKPSPEGKRALIDQNGKVITDYIYDRIDSKRNRYRKGEYLLKAERDGIVGTLNMDGTEQDDFRSVVNKRKEYKKREQENNNTTLNRLKGEWYGTITMSGQEYLSKIRITDANVGVRTIYYLEEGKECEVEQYFNSQFLSDGKTLLIIFQTNIINTKCGTPPTAFSTSNLSLFSKEILSIEKNIRSARIKGRTKKESASNQKDSYDILRKIKKLKPIESDFKSKVESRPGGLRYPEFSISAVTGKIQVLSYGTASDFGIIEVKKDGYVFKPRDWVKDSNFHLSGILRNVRYLDKNGKEKIGDLDVCFKAMSKQNYFFREMLK